MALKPELKADGSKVYRASTGTRIIVSILLPCFLLMLILGVQRVWLPAVLERHIYNLVVSTGLFIIGPILGFWWIWQGVFVDRLIVTADGLEFYGVGTHGKVRWNEMITFIWHPYGRPGWGIKVADDIEFQYSLMARLTSADWMFSNVIRLSHWQSVRYQGLLKRQVDLGAFEQTPLGQDLLHYAPHLFEDVERGTGPHPRPLSTSGEGSRTK